MTDKPNYRIWQSPESVLLQHESGWMELSIADAIAIAVDITARLAPAEHEKVMVRWTPERSAECVRLYNDDGLGANRISKRIGVSTRTVQVWLKKAGVQMRPRNTGVVAARAALAAKRAQRAA